MIKVGYVGLGNMGLPMTRNLIAAGFDVQVRSRSKGPVAQAVAAGATEAAGLADLAAACDLVCTCVPMPEDVEAIYLGDAGLVSGITPGTILIDHSTVGPDTNRRVNDAASAAGGHFLDAPVSGGPAGAEAGTLAIMVGGEAAVFEQAKPVLDALGKTIVHLGPCGSGSVAKLINNMLVGVHLRALIESLQIAARSGVDLDGLSQVLMGGSAASFILERMYPLLRERNFEPRFRAELFHKDLRLAVELARACGVDAADGKAAFVATDQTLRMGHGGLDNTAMLLALEAFNKVKLFE